MTRQTQENIHYACHEGNHDIRHIIEVARNVERQAAEPPRGFP